jgi:hypothetical protein
MKKLASLCFVFLSALSFSCLNSTMDATVCQENDLPMFPDIAPNTVVLAGSHSISYSTINDFSDSLSKISDLGSLNIQASSSIVDDTGGFSWLQHITISIQDSQQVNAPLTVADQDVNTSADQIDLIIMVPGDELKSYLQQGSVITTYTATEDNIPTGKISNTLCLDIGIQYKKSL